jgi:aspartyl/asparaginyl beta-hydroxylase (cupin superfamily)
MPDPAYIVLERMLQGIELLGRRYWRHSGPLPEPSGFPWLRTLTEAADTIAAEAHGMLQQVEPADTRSLNDLSVGVAGSWQLLPLMDRLGRYPYAVRLPGTIEVLGRIPHLRAADLALLTAGSSIHPHRGNNWGVLRAHLTLDEPAGDAVCALRFPRHGLAVPWRAGEVFIFDDSFEHEAINHRGSGRLVLLVEVDRPLPPGLAQLNALCQRWYRHHPVQRGVRDRAIAQYRGHVGRESEVPSGGGMSAAQKPALERGAGETLYRPGRTA